MRGKFLFLGPERLWVRGVTYGTFRPDESGSRFPRPEVVERDFGQMAANGINAVRTYTPPPTWLLDTAHRHGIFVMVGLLWEQYEAFLERRGAAREIEERLRGTVRALAGHPAILCYAIGNEIPAPIVRWYGRQRVERFLARLCRAVKGEDPGGLFTYVNYPTTEYLSLPFLDLVCFNVYLEVPERYKAYLARLHNLAGARPLVMAEIGLDSRRNGEEAQARAVEWQVRAAFESGCAGAFVFSWTDEWNCAGQDIEDWEFGLTTRERRPKKALAAVRKAFAEVPFPASTPWPRVSVVVCSYNGSRTLRDTLEGLMELEYPDREVIVVDDGSKDSVPAIASEFPVRLIRTENRGLSSARNTGLEAAAGEIVAYIDDDARPDPHWLSYLAATFLKTNHAGVGGPNLPPPGDGAIAECVANAPGGPNHVLLSDTVAEHIPGCNMAFRKAALQAVGGFDPRFRVAGDDVDLCWRLQERGWTLGFSPAAVVWHHRRNSLRTYWRQQRGYGKAEALLERKWPEKYNGAGHLKWAGRVYGPGLTKWLKLRKDLIYHGFWGCAPFQSLYQPAPARLSLLPLMPEWYLVVLLLGGLTALGALWKPLLLAAAPLALASGALFVQACASALGASFPGAPRSRLRRLGLWGLTALLHLGQPLARLWGRLAHGLAPWGRTRSSGFSLPWPRKTAVWSERWRSLAERLRSLQASLRAAGIPARAGGDYDRWDLEVGAGFLGCVRVRAAIEEYGAGRQMLRLRVWPRCSAGAAWATVAFAGLSLRAAWDGAWPVGAVLGAAAALLAAGTLWECGRAMGAFLRALDAERAKA